MPNHKALRFKEESFETTFDKPARYLYYFEIHRGAGETGEITVMER